MKFSCQACGSTAVPVTDCVSLQDPQYMQQALTNALLMDAAVGSLQNSKSIYAASKLAHFDRIKMEGVGTGFFFCCCPCGNSELLSLSETHRKWCSESDWLPGVL